MSWVQWLLLIWLAGATTVAIVLVAQAQRRVRRLAPKAAVKVRSRDLWSACLIGLFWPAALGVAIVTMSADVIHLLIAVVRKPH